MKKLFALALSLIMLLGTLSTLPVMAAGETTQSYTDTVSMTTLYNGDKTVVSDTVYSISTAAELVMFNELCNDNSQTFEGATVIVTENIDLNEGWTASATAPTGDGAVTWTPIANFKGVFDGQNNTIKGFYISTTVDTGTGIFAVVSGANCAIKNLKIENSYVKGNGKTGVIAGIADQGLDATKAVVISNVSVSATVESTGDAAGGIVGYVQQSLGANRTKVTIENSGFSGTVTGTSNIGGILGHAYRGIYLNNCTNNGTVTTTKAASPTMGGIVGLVNGFNDTTVINNCINKGTVYASIALTGGASLGGIIGLSATTVSSDGCKNEGSVYTAESAESLNIGGILGRANEDSYSRPITLSNGENNGNVYVMKSATGTVAIGGIIGTAFPALTVSNCVNKKAITTTGTMGFLHIGGIVGQSALYDDGKTPKTVSLTNCVNTAAITPSTFGTWAATNDCNVGGVIGKGVKAYTYKLNKCANFGDITVGVADYSTRKNATYKIGGIFASADGVGLVINLTDCISAGDLSSGYNTSGGLVGAYTGPNATIERCLFTGKTTSYHNTYVGGFVGYAHPLDTTVAEGTPNMTLTIIDSYCSTASINPVGAWFENSGINRNVVVTAKAGDATYSAEVAAGGTVKNDTYRNGINQPIKDAGFFAFDANGLLDLNAMKNLPETYDWTDATNGWVIEQVNGEGNYIPMPASVAKLVAVENEAKSNGVDYHGVQVKNDKSAVRFVATVDDLNRDEIGFKVIVIKDGQHAEYELEDSKVYESLTYTKETDTTLGTDETELYTVDGKLLGAIAFDGLSATGRYIFAVKAFSKTGESYSYDDTYIVIIEDGAVAASYQK